MDEVMAKGWRRAGKGMARTGRKTGRKKHGEESGKIHGNDDGRSGVDRISCDKRLRWNLSS